MSVMANTDMNRVVSEPVTQEAKPEKVTLVELRNGKLVFKQKPMSFEKLSETMQEIVKFREMLEQRIEAGSGGLTGIPDDHKPLIAKLVHESDKGIQALSRHIQQELLPAQDEDDEEACKTVAQALPLDVVEKTVKSVASRQNYGLDNSHSGVKVPAAWQVWRWEVKDEYRCWLPKVAQEKIQARFLERQQAKRDVLALFQALSESEQQIIIGTKIPAKTAVVPGRDKMGLISTCSSQAVVNADYALHTVTAQQPIVDANADHQIINDGSPDKKGPSRPKKAADPEKTAKEKEREARKNAKAEKEKKEKDAYNKSKNMFASFFMKPKASGSGSRQSSVPKEDAITLPTSASPSNSAPDFARTFRPFTLKKDAELAPVNWFHEVKQRNKKGRHSETVPHRVEGNVIIIEDDDEGMNQGHNDGDIEMQDLTTMQLKLDLGQMTAAERLQDVLSAMPRSHLSRPPRKRMHREFKSYHPYPVRTILTQMNEAEIAGDDEAVRRLLALLRDRSAIPAKVLIFSEDARPGYYGTWTRNSREVGPRTPFARDVVAIDYSYDSGEEWEEEPGEADDVLEGEEEEDNGEEADSDLDSWLVDDDVADPGTPLEERAGSPDFFDVDLPPPLPKRKTNDNEAKNTKKRKVVVPLVPFSKGPCWENVIGHCDYEPFTGYRIQLFNDTPFPINPFTFVSVPEEKSQTQAAPHNAHTTSNVVFAVPALPSHVTASTSQPTSLTASTASVPKRAAPPPRTVFPDQHIPLLLSKIASLETGNLTYLVETVHKELTEFKVKKNSIEAKIKEVGEKGKEGKKVWVIKPEVKVVYGIA